MTTLCVNLPIGCGLVDERQYGANVFFDITTINDQGFQDVGVISIVL